MSRLGRGPCEPELTVQRRKGSLESLRLWGGGPVDTWSAGSPMAPEALEEIIEKLELVPALGMGLRCGPASFLS